MTARVYAGLSAGQQDERRRDQLLKAGLEVFAGRGRAGITVRLPDGCAESALLLRVGLRLRADPRRGPGAARTLQLSAVLVTGGVGEPLIAWDSDAEPLPTAMLVEHVPERCTAAAQL